MAQIKRHASAQWQGSGKDGSGSLTTQSGTLAGPDGVPLDARYAWFVVLRVSYDDG